MRYLAKSGVGHTESAIGFDEWCKWKFTLPEICADDDWMAEQWESYCQTHLTEDDHLTFARRFVHNGDLNTKQMADVITQIYHFFGEYGIELPDPNDYRDELEY